MGRRVGSSRTDDSPTLEYKYCGVADPSWCRSTATGTFAAGKPSLYRHLPWPARTTSTSATTWPCTCTSTTPSSTGTSTPLPSPVPAAAGARRKPGPSRRGSYPDRLDFFSVGVDRSMHHFRLDAGGRPPGSDVAPRQLHEHSGGGDLHGRAARRSTSWRRAATAASSTTPSPSATTAAARGRASEWDDPDDAANNERHAVARRAVCCRSAGPDDACDVGRRWPRWGGRHASRLGLTSVEGFCRRPLV